MPVTDLPLFAALKTRMYWLEERQKLIAENVANADTPNFRGRDLKQLDFDQLLRQPLHLASAGGEMRQATRDGDRAHRFEISAQRHPVVLEDEMLKAAQNQTDHQTVTALYARGLGLIKAALGKR